MLKPNCSTNSEEVELEKLAVLKPHLAPHMVFSFWKSGSNGAIVRDTSEESLSSKACTRHVMVHVTFHHETVTERVTERDTYVTSITP